MPAGTCLDDLRGEAGAVDRGRLLDCLLEALARRRIGLDDAEGRLALADEIRDRCATLGHEVQVILTGEVLTGLATTIDDEGRLIVQTASGAPGERR